MDRLYFPSHSRLPKSTFSPHPTQSVSPSSSYPFSFFSSTEHTCPPFCLRVNDIYYLRHCPTLQNRGKAVVGSPVPRRASNPCLWSGRFAKNLAVGDSKWSLSQQTRQYVFLARDPVSSAHICFPVPKAIGLTVPPLNPALPPRKVAKIPSRFRPPAAAVGDTTGHGPKRVYLDVQARPPNVAYPPRPVPGSVADLDIVMDLCEFPSKVRLTPCPSSPSLKRISIIVCP
jgi:hypothetical protein